MIIATALAAKIATSPATEYHTATAEMLRPLNNVINGMTYLSVKVVFMNYYLLGCHCHVLVMSEKQAVVAIDLSTPYALAYI
jgi:hypothetical protein